MVKAVLTKTPAPYFGTQESTHLIYWKLSLALFPLIGAAMILEGPSSLKNMAASILGAVLAETAASLWTKRKILSEGSSIYGALLLALLVPAGTPFLLLSAVSFLAFMTARYFWGGLGQEMFQPALAGYVILYRFFPECFSGAPSFLTHHVFLKENFWAADAGMLAAFSISAVILIWQKMIRWQIPALFLAGYYLATYLPGAPRGSIYSGLLFAALFFVTDTVTIPLASRNRKIYACLSGLAAGIWVVVSGKPESVFGALLVMSAITPLFDQMPFILKRS